MNQGGKNYRMKMTFDSAILEKPPVWRRQSYHILLIPVGSELGQRGQGGLPPKRGGAFILGLEA